MMGDVDTAVRSADDHDCLGHLWVRVLGRSIWYLGQKQTRDLEMVITTVGAFSLPLDVTKSRKYTYIKYYTFVNEMKERRRIAVAVSA